MNLVFCGTPSFAVPTLEAVLAAGHRIALVLTQPDRAAGRGLELQPSPVKRAATALGLPVLQPKTLRANDDLRARLEAIAPDAILVVAYGRIVPRWMLDLPRHGNINLHASLLPKYRGAAPIQWAIASGETVTAATTMRIDEGLDTGGILLARTLPIAPDQTAVDLFPALAADGASLMVETLAGLAAGTLTATPQDDARATLAPILTREDGRIDFTLPAQRIYDRWRGFQPWPGAHTTLRGRKLIVHRMHPAAAPQLAPGGSIVVPGADPTPGSILAPGSILVRGEELFAGAGEGTALALDELQLEGKRRMPAGGFLRGFQLRSGEGLGE